MAKRGAVGKGSFDENGYFRADTVRGVSLPNGIQFVPKFHRTAEVLRILSVVGKQVGSTICSK